MEYNNFYPNQIGMPPNHQHGGPQMQQQLQGPPQMMHGGGPNQNNMRHVQQQTQHGHQQQHHHHQSQHPQMQPQPQMQQHLAQNSQQQQQPNYLQNHGPQIPHSNSPLSRPQSIPHGVPQQHHNQQQPPLQHIHHQQSMHGGPLIHVQPQQQSQQVNHQARPPMAINHPHAQQISQQHHQHHPQNFFPNQGPGLGPGGPPQAQNIHYIPHQNQNHSQQHQGSLQPPLPHHHHQQQQSHPHHHHNHHPQGPIVHHHSITSQAGPPPPPHIHHQHQHHHNNIQGFGGRNSPCYQPMLQTEARIMEINRRLQMRPIHIVSPLPSNHDDHQWWDRFALEFFDDDATMTIRDLDVKPTTFTIGRILIPRFFKTYFDGGATDLFINIRNPRETLVMNNLSLLDCDACMVANTRWRATEVNPGAVVHSEGQLTIEFLTNFDSLLIKSWKFYTRECKEFLDRESIHRFGLEAINAESLTRSGLSKPTALFLSMCKVIEPMQELMSQYKILGLPPKECLRRYLADKYKFRVEETRVPTNKRRKRKPSAAPIAGAGTNNKRTKVSVNNNNTMINNNGMMGNNSIMCPSRGTQNFMLTSQDVMTVGEPSMMGGDFGDDNERLITRLENSQYEPSGQTPILADESNSMTNLTTIDENNGLSTNNSMDHLNDTMSSTISQDQSQQQHNQHQHQQQDQRELVEDSLQHQQQHRDSNQQQEINFQHGQQEQEQNHHDQEVQLQQQSTEIVQEEDLEDKSKLPLLEEDINQDAIITNRVTTYETTLTSPLEVIKQEIEKIAQETNQITFSQSKAVEAEQSSNNHNNSNNDNNSNDNINNINSNNINNDDNIHDTIDQSDDMIGTTPAGFEHSTDEIAAIMNHDDQQTSDCVESKNEPITNNDLNENRKLQVNPIKIEQLPKQEHQEEQQQTLDINPIQQLETHTNSIQPLNEESDSNSQLTCSTTPATSAMEQQHQPVNNGVA